MAKKRRSEGPVGGCRSGGGIPRKKVGKKPEENITRPFTEGKLAGGGGGDWRDKLRLGERVLLALIRLGNGRVSKPMGKKMPVLTKRRKIISLQSVVTSEKEGRRR